MLSILLVNLRQRYACVILIPKAEKESDWDNHTEKKKKERVLY